MKLSHGKIILIIGCMHAIMGISPAAFGDQYSVFANQFFFKVSEGLFEFPLLNGQMNYENFAAFWFVYFGVLLIPLGILADYIEKVQGGLPKSFIWSYIAVIAVGVFMIPFSGMTLIMLPHALYMAFKSRHLQHK